MSCNLTNYSHTITITNFTIQTKVCAKKCMARGSYLCLGPTGLEMHASTASAPCCVETQIFGHLGQALDQSQYLRYNLSQDLKHDFIRRHLPKCDDFPSFWQLPKLMQLDLGASWQHAHSCRVGPLNSYYSSGVNSCKLRVAMSIFYF